MDRYPEKGEALEVYQEMLAEFCDRLRIPGSLTWNEALDWAASLYVKTSAKSELAYRQCMMATKHAAEKKIRDQFQAKWALFHRCSHCGRRPRDEEYPQIGVTLVKHGRTYAEAFYRSLCCNAPLREHRYSPPPEE